MARCRIPCACRAKRHLNVQKCSENGVFCTFCLRNVLRAKTACAFSTPQLPKVIREWCVLYISPSKCFAPQPLQHLNFQKCSEPGVFCNVLCILTWTCASCHNGVHFFISHLPRWLRTPRFSEPILVDPPEPQNIGKPQCFATCLPFRAPASSFF